MDIFEAQVAAAGGDLGVHIMNLAREAASQHGRPNRDD